MAQDYVYAFRRVIDPANISPIEPSTIDLKIKGLAAVRDAAVKSKAVRLRRLIDGCARSIATRCASSSRSRDRASSIS